MRHPEPGDDPKVLDQINELGEKVAQLFDGYNGIVVINVTGLLFAGAAKVGKLPRLYIHELLDRFLDSDDGLTEELKKPN